MNEIALSNDLNQIELEIKHHKQVAGQSMWEIGRRLNHVKDNDLAHGEFIDWVESKLNMSRRHASRFMKVANEFPNGTTLSHVGESALYLIATLPEKERNKEHTLETGETKSVDEMTVRELQETKRKLREKEQEVQDLKNAEPEIIEKEVVKEVKPHDYEGLKSDNIQLEQVNKRLRNELDHIESRNKLIEKEYESLVQQQKETDVDSEKYRQLNEDMKKMNNELTDGQKKLKAQKEVYDLVRESNRMLETLAPIPYLIDIEHVKGNEYAMNALNKTVDSVETWLKNMNQLIEEKNIIEGVFVNE